MQTFIVGPSPQMQELVAAAGRLAATDCPILLVGERGSGRGSLGREIHRLSKRSPGLVAEAAASTLPIGDELDGAVEALIVDTRHGTLLLTRIEHLSHQAQSVLMARHTAHGALACGTTDDEADARLLLTSALEIPRLVNSGCFSAYFFEVLAPMVLQVPALRDRAEDIPLLAGEFLRHEAERMGMPPPVLAPGALALLSSHRWTGNVTELRETVIRLLHESPKEVIGPEELERALAPGSSPNDPSTLAERNRRYTLEVLERTGGNKSRAAAVLGITRQTLYHRLRGYGLIDVYSRGPRH